jgi:diguanylate cyclase (GGDEF)-like protein/PAS domain S-box-containing protein
MSFKKVAHAQLENSELDLLWADSLATEVIANLQPQTLATMPCGLTIVRVTEEATTVVYANKKFYDLLGYTPLEIVGKDCTFLKDSEADVEQKNILAEAMTTGRDCTVVLESYRKDGSLFWNEVSLTFLGSGENQVSYYVLAHHDVTARVEAEAQLRQAEESLERTTLELERVNAKYYHDALHDGLTGLANRSLLSERLGRLLGSGRRSPGAFAVLYLDLDGFKHVNDSLGHAVGDKLLIAVAERLKTCVRPTDTAARLGGDEFAVLLESLEHSEEAKLVAERIQKVLEQSFIVHAHTLHVSSSIGIALYTSDYTDSSDLLRDADAAMYNAKQSGKNQVVVFEPTMRTRTGTLEVDLRSALNKKEITVHYQPVLNTTTRTLAGFEALVRWQHPTRGELLPDLFIPLAEETGLIVTIDRFVLREGCKQLKAWQELSGAALTLSVNLSGYQLFRPDLVLYIKTVLEETNVDPQCLRLELTETVMMNVGSAVQKRLQELCDLGVQLYIDDFGKGYSSLGYLQTLPSKTLKIDRSFTERIDKGFEGEELVRTIVLMARNLGLTVVTEGIESHHQLGLVTTLGCEFVQGNLFSPALAPRDIERFIFEAQTLSWYSQSSLQTL